MPPEVLLQQHVDGPLEHERVVDRDVAHVRPPEPARLPAPRVRRVHHVVADQEEGLQQLDQPAERAGGFEVWGVGECDGCVLEQEGDGVRDREAAVAFSANGVVVE